MKRYHVVTKSLGLASSLCVRRRVSPCDCLSKGQVTGRRHYHYYHYHYYNHAAAFLADDDDALSLRRISTRKRKFSTNHNNNEDVVAVDSPSQSSPSASAQDLPATTTTTLAPQQQQPTRRFDNQDDVELHPILRQAVVQAGFHVMTDVQAQTFDPIRDGKDVTARARTGTGKTIAFLVPSLQRILGDKAVTATTTLQSTGDDDENNEADVLDNNSKIRMLILSPTRELAQQIHVQAKRLAQRNHNMHAQVMVGGIPKSVDIQRLQSRIPTVLTATLGRLLDHVHSTLLPKTASISDSLVLQSTDAAHTDKVPFRDFLSDVQILVLDEMDSLLDMGFRDLIRKILKHLPTDRQTLLFSATTSKAVRQMVKECVRENNVVVVDCVDEATDPSAATNAHIRQSYVILPENQMVWRIVQILTVLTSNAKHKVLVFFPTTAQVVFFARLFQHGLGQPVLEMHSQLSQGRRSVISDRFRQAKSKAVLFTTDLSARGVDYPHVTHVVQVGVAPSRETYIHRLGRTGRAGRSGQGIVLLAPPEVPFLHADLEGLPLEPHHEFQKIVENPLDRRMEENRMHVQIEMRDGQWPLLKEDVEAVYEALLGYYTSRIRAWSKGNWQDDVVQLATEYCRQTGLSEMPGLNPSLAEKLGLMDHPGVVVRDRWAAGRAFDVGRRQEDEHVEEIWSKPPPRRKSLSRERLTNSSGLWDEADF